MRALSIVFLFVAALASQPASAQLALPGAVAAPTPEGQTVAPPPVHRAAAPKPSAPIKPKPPSETSVVGPTFALNGMRGALQIEKNGAELRVVKLVLAGWKISHPNQACEVAMGQDAPLPLKPMGTPEGLARYEVQSSACPLDFDLLGGALRASAGSEACVFPRPIAAPMSRACGGRPAPRSARRKSRPSSANARDWSSRCARGFATCCTG